MRCSIRLICLCTLILAACGTEPSTNQAQSSLTGGGSSGGGSISGGGAGHVPKTTLSSKAVKAGAKVSVACTWSDTGKPIDLATLKVPSAAKSTSVDLSGGRFELMAEIAGDWTVACSDVGLGEVDPNPPGLKVTPAAAVSTKAVLDPATIAVGDASKVTCEGVDAYGNRTVGGTFTLAVSPADVATVDGLKVSGVKIGSADVSCLLAGGDPSAAKASVLTVSAGAVVGVVAKGPAGSTTVGDIAKITCEAQDAAGNVIAVPAAALSVVAEKPLNVVASGGLGVVTTKAGKWPVRCALKSPQMTSPAVDVSFVAGPATAIGVAFDIDSIVAGDSGTKATCTFVDGFGNPTSAPKDVVSKVDGGKSWSVAADQVSSTVAGVHEITCSAQGASLKQVASKLTVSPATPAFSKGGAKPSQGTAGKPIAVSCTAYDAYGNVVTKQPTDWTVKVPTGCKVAGGATVTCTLATKHAMSCQTKTKMSDGKPLEGVAFDVTVAAAAPISLKLKLDPEQPNYTTGQKIGLIADAKDAYGNAVKDLTLAPITMSPKGFTLDKVNAQVTCEQDGLYTVSASLKTFPQLKASRKILSDSSGPLINVSSPKRGLTRIHTSTVTVSFSAADELSALASVSFNGKTIKAGDGIGLKAVMSAVQGLNLVKIVAKDKWGNASSHVQSFYSGKAYYKTESKFGSSALINNGVEAWLGQKVLDSGYRNHKKPKDIATVVEVILKNFDTKALLSSTFPVSYSIFKFLISIKSVKFGDSKINGGYPKIKLTAKAGALGLKGSLYNMVAKVYANGQNSISPNLNITVSATSMAINGDLYISLKSNGSVAVTNKNVSVKLYNLKVTVDNKWGWLVNWLIKLFDGTITNALQDSLVDQLKTKINAPLADMLEGFALDTTFNVPGFFGGSPTPLKLSSSLYKLYFQAPKSGIPGGALIRLKAGLTSAKKVKHTILGSLARRSCLKTYQSLAAMKKTDPMEVSMHFDSANQLLTSMWQSGALVLQVDPSALSGLDFKAYGITDLKVKTDFLLPPLLNDCVAGGSPELQMGDIRMDITAKMGGKALVVRAYISAGAKVVVEAAKGLNGKEISLSVGKIATLESDIESVLLDGVPAGESTAGFFEKLLPAVTSLLVGQLQGTLASFPLPELDLSVMTTAIPKGTTLALDVKQVLGSKGHVYMRGGIK